MKQVMRFADVIAGLIWFVFLIAINLNASEPSEFILAYAIPVVAMTWKRDFRWGFMLAAVRALSAVASGAITGNANADICLAEEGGFSFA